MSERGWSVFIVFMIIIMITSIALSGILINKIKNDKNTRAGCHNYEITTNDDEKILDRGTSYNIDEMGNLSILFNDVIIILIRMLDKNS